MALPHDDVGSGPAALLLHAGIADRRMWRGHLEPLAAAGYRAIAVDLPGFGEAPEGSGERAPWVDVIETLDALSVERATLVGNSFGGAVALRAAWLAPERVTALVMISAPSPDLEPSAELQAAWQTEEAAMERGDVGDAVEVVLETWLLPDAAPELRELVAAMQSRAYELQSAAAEHEIPDPLEQAPDALAGIRVPALVAAGDRDKPEFVRAARSIAEALPNARHAVIEGAGHLAPLETPAAVHALVLDFLRDSV